LKSIFRDSWEVLDEADRPIAKVEEDSTSMALLRRFHFSPISDFYQLLALSGLVKHLLRDP
jgi:hypothetical protein